MMNISTNLGLVSNKVDLWLAGLCWQCCWHNNIWLFIGSLHKYIDQCLLFILWLQWNNWSRCGRWRRCLNENDLVVFLCGRERNRATRNKCRFGDLAYAERNGKRINILPSCGIFRFWWWNMHIDVLVNNWRLTRSTIGWLRCSIAGADRCSSRCSVARTGRRWFVVLVRRWWFWSG